jgi:hypothetical protein
LEEAGPLLAGFPDPYSQAVVVTRLGRAHEHAGNPRPRPATWARRCAPCGRPAPPAAKPPR